MLAHTRRDVIMSGVQTLVDIAFSSCFYFVFILGHRYQTSKLVAIKVLFSVLPSTYSVIYSEKICPLCGKILITFLKCSRASFSPSSYSEKIRWGRGCEWIVFQLGLMLLNWFMVFLKDFNSLTERRS